MQFACNFCGKCCRDRHLPLTLAEARQWVAEGGRLIIVIEAFLADGTGVPSDQRDHAQRRSLRVRCGDTDAYVAITFAGHNTGACRHLTDENRCAIHHRRPLVCRIYPMEINPHIPLRPQSKDCAPETWHTGPVFMRDGRVIDSTLSDLIERSRQADRNDIAAKAAICKHLGIDIAALKGDGFATYLPEMDALLAALRDDATRGGHPVEVQQDWTLHVARGDLADTLTSRGARVVTSLPETCTFVQL